MLKKIDPRNLEWISEPKLSLLLEDSVVLETEPYTEIKPKGISQQVTEMAIHPIGNFNFTTQIDFKFQDRFDQCGIIIYENDVRKAIVCTECFDEESNKLSTTVFHGNFGDRAYRDIASNISTMYYRIWYRGGIVGIQYSFTNEHFRDLRKFHVDDFGNNIKMGIYACSPSDSYFDCTFSNMILEDEE